MVCRRVCTVGEGERLEEEIWALQLENLGGLREGWWNVVGDVQRRGRSSKVEKFGDFLEASNEGEKILFGSEI